MNASSPLADPGHRATVEAPAFTVERLQAALLEADRQASAADQLTRLVALGLDRLPLPGAGDTLTRWRALAVVAAHDLSLVKLYEGHTDALAILAELGCDLPPADVVPGATWGVWASEAPGGRTTIESVGSGDSGNLDGTVGSDGGVDLGGTVGSDSTVDLGGHVGRGTVHLDGTVPLGGTVPFAGPVDRGAAVPFDDATRRSGAFRLGGSKYWCSGADSASHALLTVWHGDGRGPQLVRIAIRQPGVAVDADGWQAVGMSGSASLDVRFSAAVGWPVGEPGDYVARPGFSQGGAGIAACWYGGAVALAETLRRAVADAPPAGRSPFRLAALGKVEVALRAASALLREGAAWIDAHPRDDAGEVALRLRLAVEDAASQVLAEVGRALGATPFCRDERFARMAADLPVFLRQSHAERDYAALGERLASAGSPSASGGASTAAGSSPTDSRSTAAATAHRWLL